MIKAGVDLNLQDYNGRTALIIASFRDSLDVAKALIKAGARVDLKNNYDKPVLDYSFD